MIRAGDLLPEGQEEACAVPRVVFYRTADIEALEEGGTPEPDPAIRIAPGTEPRIVLDEPLKKDLVRGILIEVGIADTDGFDVGGGSRPHPPSRARLNEGPQAAPEMRAAP
jgi:hypothetical protein